MASSPVSANQPTVIEDLEKDAFVQEVQAQDFSVQNYVTSLLTSSTVKLSTQIASLTQSLAKIDQVIHYQVSTNHGDLLAQTSNIEVMDNVVLSCSQRAKQCMDNVSSIDAAMTEHEENLEKQVEQLEKLTKILQLLRKAERVAKLESMKNLSAAKQALNVSEIEHICRGSEPFLKASLEKASGLRRNMRKQTENMVTLALDAKSPLQVTSALQILINLNDLDDVVEKIFSDAERTIKKDITSTLTVKVQTAAVAKGPPGRAASVNIAVANQSSLIWGTLQSLTSKIVSTCAKVKLIWQVLLTNRDQDSNLLFSKFLKDESQFWIHFWNQFVSNFEKELTGCTDVVKTTFEAEYPKLLQFVTQLCDALVDQSNPSEITPLMQQLSLAQSLRSTIVSFEKAYLSKSLQKLFDQVNHVFATNLPSEGDIDTLTALFKQTLDVTSDEHLKRLLSRNISKTIHLVCVRFEGQVIVDGSATQVIGTPSQSQQTNNKIVAVLEHFKFKLHAFQPPLQPEESDSISILQKNTIWSLVNAIADAIEAIILTIHQENWNRLSRATEYSLYIGELQSFIARATKDYLHIQSQDLLFNCTSHLSSRTIDLITRHASIVPNLASIKDQLIIDLSQLELALAPFTPSLSELGKPFKLLKGFKSLLQMDPKSIESSNLVPNVVPASVALYLLFTMSNDKLLVAPHVAKSWSPVRFSRWMDEKSESDKISVIASSLNEYVKQVSASGQQEYYWTYPIMISLVKKVSDSALD